MKAAPTSQPSEIPNCAPLFLTTDELAGRWRTTPKVVQRRYRDWGLQPIVISRRFLFRLDTVEAIERERGGQTAD